jgi:hypothetical protein
VRNSLVEEYPGYAPEVFTAGKIEGQVRQLYGIVREPAVQRTEAGQALARYVVARDKAMQIAQAQGRASFARADSMRSVRTWLRDVGGALVDEYPQFAELWDRVLEREMTNDEEEVAVSA